MVICFSFSSSVYAEEIVDSPENSIDMDYFEGVMKMVKEKYKGQVTEKELLEGALKGIFDSMDPYTTYFTNEEAQAFLEDIEGTYEGIGVSFSQEGNSFVVMDVFESSPAEDAGIIEGDIIVEVNGESVSGKATEQLAGLIKGEEGTKVNLSIMRKGINEFIKMEVLRKKIEISPVTFNIKGDIGYIRLDVFNSNARMFINAALKEMDNKNIKKIILDLRDNPGGDVSEAVAMGM
jgi:carboxyl-terminal processing protease